VCALWIISYHPFAVVGFEDYKVSLSLIHWCVFLVWNYRKGGQDPGLFQQREDCENHPDAFRCKRNPKILTQYI
jgi:hypothetical protein